MTENDTLLYIETFTGSDKFFIFFDLPMIYMVYVTKL